MAHRILVVDDDKQIVRLVQSSLQQAGFTVLTAYDGENALRLIRHERPDLVVLDLTLPRNNGPAITRVLRGPPRQATQPILTLTARVENPARPAGRERR